MSQPIPAPVPLTYQEILRSIGAWIDVRGYREVRIEGDADGLTIEGVLDQAGAGDEREQLLLDGEQLHRFCQASRLNRSPAPTVGPPSRPHLTLVSCNPSATDSDDTI
jgi:hypothetical protein